MNTTTRQVLKYALLPGILPRFRDLFSSGFGHVSYFMAQVFRAARLLPDNHPYLNPANIGKFGIHHVIAQAGAQLRFRKENIDQIAIFSLLMVGMVIMFMQVCFLGFAIFINAAGAQPILPDSFEDFFGTANPTDDVAFVLLDRVFGIPDFFNSCVAQSIVCFNFLNPATDIAPALQPDGSAFPWPYHEALRSMLQMYSVGLLVIAVLIFCYFIVAIVAETAQEGTPFGRRFNKVWAPLRMVVALGLLIPVANGLNSGQYIMLYLAKWGSGFATNGWNLFTETAVVANMTAAGVDQASLVAKPNTPEITTFLEFMTTLDACWAAEAYSNPPRTIVGYLVKDTREPDSRVVIDTGTTYQEALEFSNFGEIRMRFGVCLNKDADGKEAPCEAGPAHAGPALTNAPPAPAPGGGDPVYVAEPGYVKDICGELVMQTTDTGIAGSGSYIIQELYFNFIRDVWVDTAGGGGTTLREAGVGLAQRYVMDPPDPDAPLPDAGQIQGVIDGYKAYLKDIIQQGVDAQATNTIWVYQLEALGWGGAGIWYNKIAQLNGSVISAAQNLPIVRNYPSVLETVRKERLKQDNDITGRNAFRAYLSGGQSVVPKEPREAKIYNAEWEAYNLWSDSYIEPTNNIFVDAIRALFGLQGLYNIRDNAGIHPLAQLVAVGKSLVDAAIRNLAFSLGTGVAGGVAMIFQYHNAGSVISAASSFLFSIAMIGLGIGFVLYYIVPFMPFIYFFFGVGGWVKAIFEAMVGIPLWALAHIRIDGDGLPGNAAIGGYYLLLEIFLRPILLIFGLLAGIIIFAAQVWVLNDIFSLVTSNLGGFDADAAVNGGYAAGETGSIEYFRDLVDQFFFTIIYTIVVYMMGMASFKLIDLIPNNILRWMGASVQSFGAQDSIDPGENLVRNTLIGTNQVGGQLGGAMRGAQGAAGETGAALGKLMGK